MATQSDTTSRVFKYEELARPSVSSLFKNQGIYNALMIGAFLLYGIYFSTKKFGNYYHLCLFVLGAALPMVL